MDDMILRALEVGDEAAFQAAVDEFKQIDGTTDFTFQRTGEAFDEYVARMRREAAGVGLAEGRVPATFLVAVVGDRIVGRISIRHALNNALLEYGGHIGYFVAPSARRCGYASEMLQRALTFLAELGVDRALLTCRDDNVPSIRIIEKHGGVLWDTRPRDGGGLSRRYWIDIAPTE